MPTAQTPSRMSRLGIFTSRQGSLKPGPSSPLSREPEEQEDEWYIPYNGPYEPPKRHTEQSQDSWGDLVNGWLSEDVKRGGEGRDGRVSQATSAPEDRARGRATSGASRMTQSTGPANSTRRNTVRSQHQRPQAQARGTPMSFVSGGVGESPMPPERSASQPLPSTSQTPPQPTLTHRASLASIFSFGRKSLRLSASMDNLAQDRQGLPRDRSNSHAQPPLPRTEGAAPARPRANTGLPSLSPRGRLSPEEEYYNTYYSTLLATPGRDNQPVAESEEGSSTSMRSHPYAYPFPAADVQPQSAPPAVDKGKGRLIVPRITLLDPRGPKIPAYLKPSPRNSLLKASMSTPNLRNLPKGKHKWLAAETWCDALIFPRPKFAMRLVDEGAEGSGRVVSPPPSPLGSNHIPDPDVSIQQRPGLRGQKALKKARSMGNLVSTPSPTPGASEQREVTPTASPPRQLDQGQSPPIRPPRPKSFAWDDLALPSPVPSLAKVLEDGRQLEADRKQWQNQANSSFLDKTAGTMSRARSKSIGAPRSKSRPRSREGERTAFEALAARTLLGDQMKLPTIHVHAPSLTRSRTSHSRSQSQSQSHTQTQSGTAQTTSVPYNPFSRSATTRTRTHAHSNSLGRSMSSRSSSGVSNASAHAHTHGRSQSLGKSALKLVVSTATNAAAFCGLTSPTGDRGVMTPDNEKAAALEGAIQSPGTKIIRLQDQLRAEERRGEPETLAPITSSSPSAALAMLSRHTMSPTPSVLSGSNSYEGVGLAITASSDDHSRPHNPGREAIRILTHPYAQTPLHMPPNATQGHNPSPSNTRQDSTTVDGLHHRVHTQPVVPSYSQPSHPYAVTPHSRGRPADIIVPPQTRMYAELTPGHVRTFAPEEMRKYSPDIPTPSVVVSPQKSRTLPAPPKHPYGPASKRTSELGFEEALRHTMRRASVDSGLGTSENGTYGPGIDWEHQGANVSPDSAVDDIVHIHNVTSSQQKVTPSAERPPYHHQSSGGGVSYNTIASSPPESVLPPAFRRTASAVSANGPSAGGRLNNSSGSSPGMVSHDSSPPLSPRIINTSEDLDRFRDLFYRPDRQSRTTDSNGRPSVGSRQTSGSIILDMGSQGSTRSGLSTLARQLSEDLVELRQDYSHPDLGHDDQRRGRRLGGLQGPRPDDMGEDPTVVLAQLSTVGSDRGYTNSPMRLPIDTTFVNPSTNVPEDVASSRASSVLQMSPTDEDELAGHFRLGEVEAAITTPSIISTPHRFSTELSLVGHGEPDDRHLNVNMASLRPTSEDHVLLSPMSPHTRSSYRTSGTDTSRMSGLSDFPAPPALLLSASHIPFNSHNHFDQRPRLEREPSLATFGRAEDDYSIGQAL